ncbi:MAG: hypothetical protein HYV75_03510 [Opitutae bacterium]|nr:hypothetical protein [Opitutae bacterium]
MTALTAPAGFNWPLAYEAEALLSTHINAFLARNHTAACLAQRMHDETGTEFFEWTDHFVVSANHEKDFRAAGFVTEASDAPVNHTVLAHPHAMLPRVLVSLEAPTFSAPHSLAIRPEYLADFMARQGLAGEPAGAPCSHYRVVNVSTERGTVFQAVERLGYRGFLISESHRNFAEGVLKARELWRTRKRDFAGDDEGVAHAFAVQKKCLDLVGTDVACELFFAEERHFWELRNRAGRVQKRRQDLLGLGWANHDHHTFRCSRKHFPDLVKFMENLGLAKRERFYAGAEAGWGAQVLETPTVGIVVFADVDLQPEEVDRDYAAERLPEVPFVRTVGLWCGLHGDSFLQAGMHHLEARFNFPLLRDQLATEGVALPVPQAGLHRGRALAGQTGPRRAAAGKGSDHGRAGRGLPQGRSHRQPPRESRAQGRFQGLQPESRQRHHRRHRPAQGAGGARALNLSRGRGFTPRPSQSRRKAAPTFPIIHAIPTMCHSERSEESIAGGGTISPAGRRLRCP